MRYAFTWRNFNGIQSGKISNFAKALNITQHSDLRLDAMRSQTVFNLYQRVKWKKIRTESAYKFLNYIKAKGFLDQMRDDQLGKEDCAPRYYLI